MNPKTSQDLFNKIRSQFSNIQIGDESGQPTADPSTAVFFEFEFKEDADTFGHVSVSLADGENMKVFYNRDLVNKIDEDSKTEWFAFLKELKDFAVEHQLRFDVRDITKSNLTKQDYQNLADTNATVNTDTMSEELNRITKLAGVQEAEDKQKPTDKEIKQAKGIAFDKRYKGGNYTGASNTIEKVKKGLSQHPDVADALRRANEAIKEGMTGTTRSSYENLDKTRLIIRHSGPVDENVPGARSRHINSLYIENEDGERFKYPITHLAGARAMTRHVANGGRPHDEFGEHIVKTSENIAQLNSFSRYVSHKDQLNDNAGDIIEQTKLKLENLRTYMRNLNKQAHYDEASKNFKPSAIADLSDDDRSAYREKFTMKHLDNRVEDVLPLIHNIMQEYKPEDDAIDTPAEPPVDHGAIVTSFLTNPDKKLVLRKDETADKMLSVTKFTNNNTMLGSILSDIASRMLTDDNNDERVANFASRVADGLEREGELFNDPDSDWPKNKQIAIQLARRYIEDYKKMQKDPTYAEQVRMDPKAKKDIKGKPKGETAGFEDWVDNTINPKQEPAPKEKAFAGEELKFEDIKPYVSMYKGDDGKTVHDVLDKDGNSVYKTSDPKDAMNYLSKNFSKLRGPAPKVGDFVKKESLKESRTKIVEAIKSKVAKEDTGFNIAGVEGDVDRVTGEAGLQIARMKYLSNY